MELKVARIRARLTQIELAAMVGIQRNSLGRYERGERRPSQELLERILKAIQDNGRSTGQER
ncbi:MAG: helix-turn-helix transcriptional regulator [Chloroflexota bacterium]|nr:helix-turn-helix transcriptional regulator [Chloroflexota bacterium]